MLTTEQIIDVQRVTLGVLSIAAALAVFWFYAGHQGISQKYKYWIAAFAASFVIKGLGAFIDEQVWMQAGATFMALAVIGLAVYVKHNTPPQSYRSEREQPP